MLDCVVSVEAREEENYSGSCSNSILHNHEQVEILECQVVGTCQSVISYELDRLCLACNQITEHFINNSKNLLHAIQICKRTIMSLNNKDINS